MDEFRILRGIDSERGIALVGRQDELQICQGLGGDFQHEPSQSAPALQSSRHIVRCPRTGKNGNFKNPNLYSTET